MSGFDPRKYHGRPLDEVLGNVNGEVRRALEEAHAVCRLCLRQKNLPARREGHVRMRLWQVEQPAAGPRPPALLRPEDFAPLFELPGTEFVSFQVGPRARDLRAGWRGLVHDPGEALADLAATADAFMEVDLVVTVDTIWPTWPARSVDLSGRCWGSPATCAGCLGGPTGPGTLRCACFGSRRRTSGPASFARCAVIWRHDWPDRATAVRIDDDGRDGHASGPASCVTLPRRWHGLLSVL